MAYISVNHERGIASFCWGHRPYLDNEQKEILYRQLQVTRQPWGMLICRTVLYSFFLSFFEVFYESDNEFVRNTFFGFVTLLAFVTFIRFLIELRHDLTLNEFGLPPIPTTKEKYMEYYADRGYG